MSLSRARLSPQATPEAALLLGLHRLLRRMIEPGEKVEITAGRHKGSKGILLGIREVPGPSQATYRLAEIKRPRAGVTYVFEHEIRKVDEE